MIELYFIYRVQVYVHRLDKVRSNKIIILIFGIRCQSVCSIMSRSSYVLLCVVLPFDCFKIINNNIP